MGYVGQFEYFDAQHVTEAIENALAKLAAIGGGEYRKR